MGQTIVQQVVTRLTDNGIAAIRAYPAERIKDLTNIRASVSLKSTDPEKGTATVLICVCSPISRSGSACEDAAAQICTLLRAMGGRCSQSQCVQLGRMDIFCVEVSAVFFGWETGNGWTNFSVSLAGAALTGVRAVKVWQSIEDAESLREVSWKFHIEEDLLPEDSEGAAVSEPFTMTVTRGSRRESYTGCTLTYYRCELSAGVLHRIRQGTAQVRTVSG